MTGELGTIGARTARAFADLGRHRVVTALVDAIRVAVPERKDR